MRVNKYTVEKFVNGEWWPEGSGTMEYVNRIINIFPLYNTPIRITEVANET